MSRGSSLLEIKLRSEAKEADEVARQERRRNVLVLILDHLSRNGYFESVQKLQQESGVSLGRFQVADNIDLVTIVQDYESFCQMKFGRLPRFVRAGTGSEEMSAPSSSNGAAARRKKQAATTGNAVASTAPSGAARPSGDSNFPPIMPTALVGRVDQSSFASGGQYWSDSPAPPQTNSNANNNSNQVDSARKLKAKGRSNDSISGTASPASNENAIESVSAAKKGAKPKNPSPIADNGLDAVNISGTQIATNSSASIANGAEAKVKRAQTQRTVLSTTPASPPPASDPASPASPPADAANDDFFSRRVLKPLPDWTGEYRELAAVISRDIYLRNPNVRWDDIVELQEAKQLLKEAIVMPMRYPQLFSGLLSPWKGVLLYGPPGTGKTMLAKAVATECRTTFFNISASSIVSKWRGDSEKLVRTLFELARYHAPSTIFIDEMDSIMGTRDQGAGGAGEHEGSRRMKTELLIQMDGLSQSTDMVFVLAASNLPWDLDQAMLRRLEKRILVPLPEKKAREHLFRTHLAPGARASGLEYDQLADRTANYSGADLVLVCKEAAMRPVRRVMSQLAAIETGVSFAGAPPVQIAMHADASSGRQGPGSGQEVVTLEPVTMVDVDAALKCIKPSTTASSLKKYSEWHSAHGAGYSTVEWNAVNTAEI